jgi:hypothetical protein
MKTGNHRLHTGCVLVLSLISGASAIAPGGLATTLSKEPAAFLDYGQVRCWISKIGSFADTPEINKGGLEFPKGSGKSVIYTAGLWCSGRVAGETRTACNYYSSEFKPGRIQKNGALVDSTDPTWWLYKISRGDNATVNMDWANWPASFGAPLDATTLAPQLWGEQQVWNVFNDLGPHTLTLTNPLGIEIRQLAWVEAEDVAANAVFLHFEIINKSTTPIDDAYIGFFIDNDLGGSGDDLVGCDTTIDLAYAYNGTDADKQYGAAAPAVGLVWLQGVQVPGVGDTTRLLNGQILADTRTFGMTSFNGYT